MKERPILFSGEMVRAILKGAKTQTRRVIKPQPVEVAPGHLEREYRKGLHEGAPVKDAGWWFDCPYGNVGDRLWVRETFAVYGEFKNGTGYCFRADGDKSGVTWKPSIFMPRAVSRITLEIIGIRVERVQDMSVEDAVNEGMGLSSVDPRWDFGILWDLINAKRGYGWKSNPWVWVVEFKRVQS